MKILITNFSFLLLSGYLFAFFVFGCSDEPTGLGEAIRMTQQPKDGNWSGLTSQNKNISFNVSNQGTRVNPEFKITVFCSEYWGTITTTITIKQMSPLTIHDNKFTLSLTGLTVKGTFENATQCIGNFSLSDNTGYPNYLSYSTSGTWATDWNPLSENLSKPAQDYELTGETEQYSEKPIVNKIVKITLYSSEKGSK